MRAIYLMGKTVYLRAMVASDKDCGIAWLSTSLPWSGIGHVFPVDSSRAATVLKEESRGIYPAGRHRYAIVRNANDEVVGALVEESAHPVMAMIGIQMAPTLEDADVLRTEALGLVVPWLRDERQFQLVRMSIPADDVQTIAAAEAAGMRAGARLQRHVARAGSRVDLLWYQALNPRWEGVDA